MSRIRELAVEATGISKSFGAVEVLRGLSLTVEAATVFALLGPNGAGKTTMINILCTLLRPDAGTARVAGHDVVAERSLVRRRIALTGQYAAVDTLQTGEENLVMMGKLCRLGRAESRRRAAALLEQFDLLDARRRTVKTYSGGMRRRLDLAASLVGHPSVIFLDEPTTGLDPRSRQEMWGVIRDLAGSGVTVFLTTQYLEEADQLADRIAVIDGGRLVADGTPEQLKGRIAGRRLDLTLADATAYAAAVRHLGAQAIQHEPSTHRLGVAADGSAGQIRRILEDLHEHDIDVETLTQHSASLEEAFLSLTGQRPASRPADGNAEHGAADRSAGTDRDKETANV